MAAYSCDITVMSALLIGVGIGALVAYGHGRDKGHEVGYDQGLAAGYERGFFSAQLLRFKRNAKGQFTK